MIKKSIYWHLYILENSRKITIFFGFTTYREKKRREGRKVLLSKIGNFYCKQNPTMCFNIDKVSTTFYDS